MPGALLRKTIAQMVMPRIEGARLSEPAYRAEAARLIAGGIGGFILFGGDVESTPAYLAELQSLAEVPLLISSDVERGLGQQLAGGTRFPTQRAVAQAVNRRRKKDLDLLNRMLDAVRIESRAAGIHIVFSPVMDVNNNPDNPIICTRAFGEDRETVEWFGSRYIRRLQKARPDGTLDLFACAKHFPGHGDTDQDSHSVLPVIRADKGRLNRVELPPFREAVKDGVGTIMVAHLLVPALDPTKPVTFSKKVVTALLREGMEFNGLIVSDALDMGALANEYSQQDIAVRAVAAGMDILLHPVDARVTIEAVARAVEAGTLTEQHIRESAGRIMAAKKRLGLRSGKTAKPAVDYEKHRMIAEDLGRKAVKLLRGSKKKLPLDPVGTMACVVMDDDSRGEGEPFMHAMIGNFGSVSATAITPESAGAGALDHIAVDRASSLVIAVFSRISASKGRSGISPALQSAARNLLKGARKAGKPSAVISFDSPYILDQFKDADLLIAGYDRMNAIQRAAADLLAGMGT